MSTENNKKRQLVTQKRRLPYYPKWKNHSAVLAFAEICDISNNRAIDILVSIGLKHLPPDQLERLSRAKGKQ